MAFIGLFYFLYFICTESFKNMFACIEMIISKMVQFFSHK